MPQVTHYLQGTEKLRELTLYICLLSEGDETFGSVKLRKLLFFCDFAFYRQTGKSLSGQEYIKLAQGPAPRAMPSLQDDMIEKGDIVLAQRNYHGKLQKKPIAVREPDLSSFCGTEIALVNDIVAQYTHLNASNISDLSHEFVGWQLAKEGEIIPYASSLLDDSPLTEQEKEWAKDLDLSELEAMFA